jgi:hypothetical protein
MLDRNPRQASDRVHKGGIHNRLNRPIAALFREPDGATTSQPRSEIGGRILVETESDGHLFFLRKRLEGP